MDRVAPPAAVTCPRNNLTSFTGRVTRWTRTLGETSLTIYTDWDTTETVTLKHAGTDEAIKWFLLNANAFQSSDWAQIEESKGKLKSGMRVTAWMCDDGRQPIVDWQPPPKK
jgi:hypothetical protein